MSQKEPMEIPAIFVNGFHVSQMADGSIRLMVAECTADTTVIRGAYGLSPASVEKLADLLNIAVAAREVKGATVN